MSVRYVDIPHRAIIRMQVEEFRHGRHLCIEHTQGKLRIDEAMLEGGAFEELCAAVAGHGRSGARGRRRAAA